MALVNAIAVEEEVERTSKFVINAVAQLQEDRIDPMSLPSWTMPWLVVAFVFSAITSFIVIQSPLMHDLLPFERAESFASVFASSHDIDEEVLYTELRAYLTKTSTLVTWLVFAPAVLCSVSSSLILLVIIRKLWRS